MPLALTHGERPRGSSISCLPEEILIQILESVEWMPDTITWYRYDYPLCLLRVCKRWSRLAERMLYRQVVFINDGYSTKSWHDRSFRLLDTLEKRKRLQEHVRICNIFLWNASGEVYQRFASLIHQCKAVHTLNLHVRPMNHQTWLLIKAASCLPNLTELRMRSEPCLNMLLQYFNMPSLKRLTVFDLGFSREGSLEASAEGNPEPSSVLMGAACSSERLFCSKIESLDFNDPSCGPALTEYLLKWPIHLKHLSISLSRPHVDDHLWNIASIQTLLDYQRHSLQDIELNIMPHVTGIPNFTQFPELTVLSLDAENFYAETPRTAFSKLSTPKLHRLTISDGSNYEISNTPYTHFHADTRNWLRKFAQHVSHARNGPQNRNTTSSSLKHVYIQINPDTWQGLDLYELKAASLADATETKIWPWHFIEETATIFATHGLLLSYASPTCTREYWDGIQGLRERAADADDFRAKKVEFEREWKHGER